MDVAADSVFESPGVIRPVSARVRYFKLQSGASETHQGDVTHALSILYTVIGLNATKEPLSGRYTGILIIAHT